MRAMARGKWEKNMSPLNHERLGILLANTGSPASPDPDDVRAYLGKFLSDPRIRPMNMVAWWAILHLFIFPKRGVSSGAKYAKIWTDEGSPFDIEHRKLARLLEAQLSEEGFDAKVELGMSYGKPFIEDGLTALRKAGCTRIIVVPLYPQSAYSTTYAVDDQVKRSLKKLKWKIGYELVSTYSADETYLSAVAQTIANSEFDAEAGDRIIFNFHSVPMNDIDAGDTYREQVEATSAALAKKCNLTDDQWAIGYNCQFDKGREWLHPFSREVLTQWAGESKQGRVFMICPNFATDCLETLYDIDYELEPFYLEQLKAAGHDEAGRSFEYIPCLNGTPEHANVLRHVLSPHMN